MIPPLRVLCLLGGERRAGPPREVGRVRYMSISRRVRPLGEWHRRAPGGGQNRGALCDFRVNPKQYRLLRAPAPAATPQLGVARLAPVRLVTQKRRAILARNPAPAEPDRNPAPHSCLTQMQTRARKGKKMDPDGL